MCKALFIAQKFQMPQNRELPGEMLHRSFDSRKVKIFETAKDDSLRSIYSAVNEQADSRSDGKFPLPLNSEYLLVDHLGEVFSERLSV